MLKNLTTRTRLLLAFGLISALMLLAAVAGDLGTRNIVATAKQTMHGELRLVQLATQLRVEVLQLRRFEKDVFINIESADKVRAYRAKWERALESANQVRNDATERATGATHESLNALQSELNAYAAGFRATAAAIDAGALKTTAQANQAMSSHKEAVSRIDARVDEIVAEANTDARKMEAIMQSHQNSVLLTLGVLTVISLLVAVVLSLVITKGIVDPVRSAVQLARSVANGKLGHEFNISTRDEVAELLHELSRMDGKLCEIIGEVHTGSVKVRSAAAELAENNDQLSQRTQEQASSLEQTAAAIEEMTSAMRTNAESATNASDLARGASQVAAAGGQVVASAVGAMSAINDSSRRISDIISVIDEIAFQTNLLALNAAVEAARAGEQGRGFAVVAGEVRSLAQRSAAAAQLDQITQQNAAGTEEIAAASKMMYEQSERLAATVSYFSVQRRAGHVTTPATRPADPVEMNEAPRYQARYGT